MAINDAGASRLSNIATRRRPSEADDASQDNRRHPGAVALVTPMEGADIRSDDASQGNRRHPGAVALVTPMEGADIRSDAARGRDHIATHRKGFSVALPVIPASRILPCKPVVGGA